MIRLNFLPLLAGTLIAPLVYAQGVTATGASDGAPTAPIKAFGSSPALPDPPSLTAAPWPVDTSLKSTLRVWTQRLKWPEPQFLTEADWTVDVPGSISGSIVDALRALTEGFNKSPTRPRIELSTNHVIVVSEEGRE